MEETKNENNEVNAGSSRPTVPIPKYGFSEDILCDDPRLRVGFAGDSLEVPLIHCLLVRDAGSVNSLSDGCRKVVRCRFQLRGPKHTLVESDEFVTGHPSSLNLINLLP